jgi:hypothetical protein
VTYGPTHPIKELVTYGPTHPKKKIKKDLTIILIDVYSHKQKGYNYAENTYEYRV